MNSCNADEFVRQSLLTEITRLATVGGESHRGIYQLFLEKNINPTERQLRAMHDILVRLNQPKSTEVVDLGIVVVTPELMKELQESVGMVAP